MSRTSSSLAMLVTGLALATGLGAQGTGSVPRPFPGSTPPQTATTRPETGTSAEPVAPSAEVVAAPIYPAAEFIAAFDAGRGQRYYMYGTNASFAEIVTYYKNALKNGGREIYKAPAIQQFDLGRFQEDNMAYPPSVVVKDYASLQPAGYLVIVGTSEKRFKTVIQIVPPPTPAAR